MASDRNDFIRDIIDEDLRAGRHTQVRTRFPPEPNGYLHIGHAKSICLNFGIARDYQGTCNLRYDDTNPTKEDVEYVDSIEADVRWLGFAPSAVLYSADYFPKMYAWAEQLVLAGQAYVCDLTDEQIREHRGTLSEPGTPSPFRDRTVAENLDLLRRMKAGEFPDGARVLRAKIDMASANMKMRDPLLYRIRHAHHHRSGDAWCIYPMYDWAHPLEDAIEGITHSICTLEFENNRELYDWVLVTTGAGGPEATRPRQYEFARLNLDYTMMSKRKLLQLVEQGHVAGWDDPRMPTIAGMRRRGYRPEALRAFCDLIGVAKANSVVDVAKLEFCVRDDLNAITPRVMGVLRPITVTLTNWDGPAETLSAPMSPPDAPPAARDLPISATILIDRDDFRDEPPAGYQRLAPGRTVRLRYGYCVTCDEVTARDASGQPTALRATVHRETLAGKNPADGRKVWGVIHWVDAATAVTAEVRLYDRLFKVARPEDGGADWVDNLNPASLEIIAGARLEASLATAPPGSRWQLERVGYFVVDQESQPAAPRLNRIITLRDASDKTRTSSTANQTDPAAATEPKGSAKAATRPKGKSPAEYRAEARVRDPDLAAKYARAIAAGATADQADLLTADHAAADLFLEVATLTAHGELAAKWLINEVPRAQAARPGHGLTASRLAELLSLIAGAELTTAAARTALAAMIETGGRVAECLAPAASAPTADDIATAIDDVMAANPAKVEQYRAGKTALLGFFVGQVMRAKAGADPALVNQVVTARLAGHGG